jgi:Ca-activated chloride channel family protein
VVRGSHVRVVIGRDIYSREKEGKSMKGLFIVIIVLAGMQVRAQKTDEIIQQGNVLYKAQQYEQAETKYNAVLKNDPSNPTARFNLGNAVFRRGVKSEAIKIFDGLGADGKTAADRSRAWYNKGVVLSSQKSLEESIEAYKNALRQDPNDTEARENLQKALLELKKKEPPKKKEDDKKKKPQQQQQKKQPQPKMSPKEAEQRLKLLEQKEKEVQERLQKEKSKSGGGNAKDW